MKRTQLTEVSTTTPTDLSNWISLAECAARLPSVQAGKRTQTVTVLRLARKHGLDVLKQGQYRFVYWPDILSTFSPDRVLSPRPQNPPRARRTLAQMAALQKRLRENGLA